MEQPRLIAISGATGIGKTAIAIAIATKLKAEIISFDSRQIYRELCIGVARPSDEELRVIPHHLIAYKSILDAYTAHHFVQDCEAIFSQNISNHKTYILCGGTGLYLRALEYGLDDLPSIRPNTIANIEEEMRLYGIEKLQNRLQAIDAISYNTIDISNPRRLQRILGLWDEHRMIYSQYITQNNTPRYTIQQIVLDMPRPLLYQRIDSRVDMMIANGLLDEVQNLYPHRHLKALHTVGYQEIFDYLENKITKEEAIDKIKQHSRNYAKRQITWNKKYLANALWIDPREATIDSILDKL